jgi:hypothetical protein
MWLRGGIDGGHDKGNALIPVLKMGTRKMAAETSRACTCDASFDVDARGTTSFSKKKDHTFPFYLCGS